MLRSTGKDACQPRRVPTAADQQEGVTLVDTDLDTACTATQATTGHFRFAGRTSVAGLSESHLAALG